MGPGNLNANTVSNSRGGISTRIHLDVKILIYTIATITETVYLTLIHQID